MTHHECPICAATFPCDGSVSDEPTLRDLFAAAVLAGSPSVATPEAEVEHAYMIAEKMLDRRRK